MTDMPEGDRVPWIADTEQMKGVTRDMAEAINAVAAALAPEGDPIHPSHYRSHPSGIEAIEVSRLCMGDMAQAIQYIWRHPDKNGHEDLKKARWFLRDLVATGQAHHPPHKAKEKLYEVIAADTDPVRTVLLYSILHGELDKTIAKITEIVGEDDA